MKTELKQTLDAVKDVMSATTGALENRVAKAEEQVESVAEQVGALIVGGPSTPKDGIPREEREKDARAFYAAALRREPRDSEVDMSALAEYSAAFPQWLRRGDAISAGYQNSMRIGSDPSGGYLAPIEFSRAILQRMFDTSPIRQVASVMSTGSSALELPLDTNELSTGGWISESDSRPETTSPTVGKQTLHMREQYVMPSVSQRLLDMADFDVDAWLVDKIARKLGRDENTAFTSGDGTDRPRGFLSYKSTAVETADSSRDWGVLEKVKTGASGAFPSVSGSTADDAGPLIDVMHKLKPEYLDEAVWMMARSTAAVVRKLKDADGRFYWQDSVTEGGRPLLLGYPVFFCEDLPAVSADSYSIVFANMRAGYLVLDHLRGLRLLRDPFSNKPNVNFYSYRYTAGDVRDFDSIKLLQFAA